MRAPITFQLLAAAYIFSFSKAQDNESQSDEDRCQGVRSSPSWFPNATYNATGSISVPGFRVNDTYPESTWTWSRFVINGERPVNRTAISQTITLKTDPIQNLTDASSLPYTGCVFVFNSLSTSALQNGGNDDDGSCSSVFTPACRSHILSTVTREASSISGLWSGSRSTLSCTSLFGPGAGLSSDASPCKEFSLGSSVSSQFLPNNFTDRRNQREPGCPLLNVGNSTLADEPFFAWQGEGTEKGDWAAYDSAVLNALPVLTVVWLKDTDGSAEPQSVFPVDGREGQWADVRLMCISANETRPGSRSLADVEKASGAGRMVGSWAVLGAVTMGVAVGLLC